MDIDILRGESRTAAYLARFPQGQVPSVEFSDSRCLAQSNAIIRYLAAGTSLLPADTFLQAKVDEMLFWEQYSHEPYIAVCRSLMIYQGRAATDREPWHVDRGEGALDLLEHWLTSQPWLAAERFTIADIALLAYTRVAPEGGFDLSAGPHVGAWIQRCELELGLK